MNHPLQSLGKDWPAFGAALVLGLIECGALLRVRIAAALRRLTRR